MWAGAFFPFVEGQLPARPVVFREADLFVGEDDLDVAWAAADAVGLGFGAGLGQGAAAVGDEVDVGLPAGGERLGVGAAAVEPKQDLPGRDDLPQLAQRRLHGLGQVRRLAGGEAHRPAPGVGDQRVGAALLGAAAFAVVALRDRLRAAVGHEMVIDVEDAGALSGDTQHRGRQRALAGQHVGGISDPGQPGPQRVQLRRGRQTHQRPGLAPHQRLDLLHRAHTAQQRQHREGGHLSLVEPPPRRPAQAGEHLPGPDAVQVGVGQHRPGVPAGIATGRDPPRPRPDQPRARRPDQLPGRPYHQLGAAASLGRRGDVGRVRTDPPRRPASVGVGVGKVQFGGEGFRGRRRVAAQRPGDPRLGHPQPLRGLLLAGTGSQPPADLRHDLPAQRRRPPGGPDQRRRPATAERRTQMRDCARPKPYASATCPTPNPIWVSMTMPRLRAPVSSARYGPTSPTPPALTSTCPSHRCATSTGRRSGIPQSSCCTGRLTPRSYPVSRPRMHKILVPSLSRNHRSELDRLATSGGLRPNTAPCWKPTPDSWAPSTRTP